MNLFFNSNKGISEVPVNPKIGVHHLTFDGQFPAAGCCPFDWFMIWLLTAGLGIR
ncbi:hypothetical protein BDZ89DRAFT_832396 [Hymenopellis radicata]|nr:hypothetical protein BDZ89DRAFT_832396 [Hymenopellis radicata]